MKPVINPETVNILSGETKLELRKDGDIRSVGAISMINDSWADPIVDTAEIKYELFRITENVDRIKEAFNLLMELGPDSKCTMFRLHNNNQYNDSALKTHTLYLKIQDGCAIFGLDLK